jgi:hypothetical protein
MSWQTPKTDWDNEDFANYGDFNRVESNIQEIQTQLNTYLTPLALTTLITNRNNTNFPYADTLNNIESNIQTLRNSFGYTPQGFSLEKKTWSALQSFDYTNLDRWETNLLLLYTLVINTISDLEYCGKSICGTEFTL